MNGSEYLALAAGALRGHAARTGFSLIGVAIGVAAVLTLTALGEGARGYVTDSFSALGTNIIAVLPGRTETTGAIPGFGGAPNDLTIADAEALQREVRELLYVSPVVLGETNVSFRERSRRSPIVGATAELLAIRELEVASGTFLPEGPWDRGTPVAVLGPKLARELFGGENAVGRSVRVGDWRLRVIGVLRSRGKQIGIDLDDVAFVPVATGMSMFDRSSLFRIVLKTPSHAAIEPARERALEVIAERHGEEDVTVVTEDAVVSSLTSILGALTLAVAGIATISLAVAGVGIMNVMLVTVSERTGEIGLFKAIGAGRRQILTLFLAESALISGTGGLLGLAAGWLATRGLALAYPALPAEPPAWAVAAAFSLSVAVGVVFGLLPAARATRLDPVLALKGK